MATNGSSESVQDVVEAVRKITPRLRENGPASEERRWLVDENLDLMEQAGVYRIAVPRAYGGLDLSAAEQAEVLSALARACPSSGWIGFVWATSAWTVTLYPESTQDEVFRSGTGRISSAFAPTGQMTAVEGGYRLTGNWRFNSGCQGSDWNFVAAVLTHPDGSHEEVMALLPMSDLSIVDDWDVSSGAATGSATTSAADVFVPADRVATFAEAMSGFPEGALPGRGYGLLSYIMIEAAAVFTGIARGAYELFLSRLPGRGITYTSWTDQSRHPLTQIQVATANNKIAAAEALAKGWFEVLQGRADAGEELSVRERAEIRGQVGFACQLAREAVETLYNASGGSVIQRSVPLQRFHRDIQGFSLHALAQLNANLELQGRVLLGLDPETPFL